jgi:sigma-70-like protein
VGVVGCVRYRCFTTPHRLHPLSYRPSPGHTRPPLFLLSHGDVRAAEKCKFLCDQDIVTQRYGLDGEDEKTLAEVGISYGLSRERVRQIERQALHSLKGNPTLRALAAEELRTPADAPAPRKNHEVTRLTPEQAEKQRKAQRDYKKRFNEKRRQNRAVGAHS